MSRKNRKLKRAITGLAAMVIILAAVFAFVAMDEPLASVFEPKQVKNLKADTCYAQVELKWDPVKGADGYEIYEDVDGVQELVGSVAKETDFIVDDYDRDKAHSYSVLAINKLPVVNKEYTGDASEPVKAYYDKDKYAQHIPVISYHQVEPAGTNVTNSICIAADRFEEQMKYLHDEGFYTLTMDEFRDWHAGVKEFPVKSCVVTFDDGFYSTHYLAYPIIKKYDQAATVFCIGKNVGKTTDEYDPNDRKSHYVGVDVIEQTKKEYPKFEYQSHTYNMHKRINGEKPVKAFTYEQMVEDCNKCKELGFTYMAYPWGTYTEEMQRALEETGFELAFAYRPFYYSSREDDTYAVERVKINGTKDLENFKKIVDGKVEKYYK